MKILFKRIKLKNFLSFGEQETVFDYKTGIHAITGNQVPNSTLRNGIGKSALLADGLVFAIYGRTLRKLNKDEIVNTQNEKECVVVVELSIDNIDYIIERGIKPTYLKIWENGNTEPEQFDSMSNTQAWFMNKIKISFDCFTNMILLNINHSKPFLEMEPKEKRPVLEDILQLTVYGRMSDLAKKNYLIAKNDIIHLETSYKNKLDNFAKTKQRKETLDREVSRFEEQKNKKIKELEDEINTLQTNKSTLSKKLEGIDFSIDLKKQSIDFKETNYKINALTEEKNSINKDIYKTNEVLKQLVSSPHCPLCSTPTENPIVKEYISEMKTKIADWESNKSKVLLDLERNKSLLNEIQTKIDNLNLNIEKYNKALNKIKEYDTAIDIKNDNLIYEKNREMKLDSIITDEDFIKITEELNQSEHKFNDTKKSFTYYTSIREILGDDGVRKYIILKVIPFLNKTVNRYLSVLGSDYTISFDDELNERLISRSRDQRAYSSFSGGEKRRIDLALLLALMDVSKAQNSIDTNILILDEVLDTSIDNEGAQSFIEHLKGSFRMAYPDKCIYIITHRKDAVGDDSFDTIIHLIKQDGFTTIDKVV